MHLHASLFSILYELLTSRDCISNDQVKDLSYAYGINEGSESLSEAVSCQGKVVTSRPKGTIEKTVL